MKAFVRHSSLEQKAGDGGLACNEDGLWVAGVNLLESTPLGFAAPSKGDLETLTKAAYGRNLDAAARVRGLGVVARALNDGDTPRAMIAALHLRLPRLDRSSAARLAEAAKAIAKYDPDQPRDWHGRWTAENSGVSPRPPSPPPWPSASEQSVKPLASRQEAMGSAGQRSPAPTESPMHDSPWGGPSHPAGGRLIQADGDTQEPTDDFGTPAIGDNSGRFDDSPHGEPGPIPNEGPPELRPERVPEGWDTGGGLDGGLYYPPTRVPKLLDGTPWPIATHDLVQEVLSNKRIGAMTLFVPNDGIGPTVAGSTDILEYERPSGYSVVRLVGTPQMTRRGGVETNHARDSIDVALKMAATNRYSEIYFNRAYSTISPGELESPLRSDVVGRVRSQWNLPYKLVPYEVFSGGQEREDREKQLQNIPGLSFPLEGHHYKLLKLLMALLRKRGLSDVRDL